MRPDGLADPAGIQLCDQMDLIQPEYPGTDIASGTNQSNWVVNADSWFVMNGYLFYCTTGGAVASAFIGFQNFNTTDGQSTNDGSAVWLCRGKAALVRAVFANLSGVTATPTIQSYALFQK
jgi:hypothetical protein